MNIDERAIRHLERLARLELAPEERKRLAKQLDRIVGYVRQLQEVDTERLGAPALLAPVIHHQHRTRARDLGSSSGPQGEQGSCREDGSRATRFDPTRCDPA